MLEGYSLVLSGMEKARSETDLAALVETYSALLFRVAYSVLRSRTEAEDVVQDVFLRVLEHQRSLPAIRDLRVWLVRIAWNLAVDRRRRVRPDQMDDVFTRSLVAKNLPIDQAINEASKLRSALNELERLPRKERQVLLLSAIEEMSTAEIVAVLEKSESAVRALASRARARLRERLAKKAKSGGRP